MGPRRIHWLIGSHLVYAQGSNTGLANGIQEPVLLPCLASACGNPKGYHRNSHSWPIPPYDLQSAGQNDQPRPREPLDAL